MGRPVDDDAADIDAKSWFHAFRVGNGAAERNYDLLVAL
jgi:hypothetical protein